MIKLTTYCVPIVYRGLDHYIVEASSPEEAEIKARARFNDGDIPEPMGNEWEEIEKIGEIELIDNG